MTTSLAFLFPGQGSQAVGMGKDLAEKYPIARQTFEEADAALREYVTQVLPEPVAEVDRGRHGLASRKLLSGLDSRRRREKAVDQKFARGAAHLYSAL